VPARIVVDGKTDHAACGTSRKGPHTGCWRRRRGSWLMALPDRANASVTHASSETRCCRLDHPPTPTQPPHPPAAAGSSTRERTFRGGSRSHDINTRCRVGRKTPRLARRHLSFGSSALASFSPDVPCDLRRAGVTSKIAPSPREFRPAPNTRLVRRARRLHVSKNGIRIGSSVLHGTRG